MKCLYSLFFIFLWILGVHAQNFEDKEYYLIDSLELNKLSEYDKDLIKKALSKYHETSQDTLKLKFIKEIIELSWDDKVWTRYNSWMVNYLTKQLADHPLHQQDLDAYTRKLYMFYGLGYNNFGVQYHLDGYYVKGINNYLKSIKIFKQIKDTLLLPETYSNLGNLYYDIKNFEKAESYYSRSIYQCEKNSNARCVAAGYVSLGKLESDRGNLDKALELLKKAVEQDLLTEEGYGIALAYDLIGEVYFRKKKYQLALEYFNKSIELEKVFNDQGGIAMSMVYIGNVYLAMKDYSKAQKNGLEGLELAKKIGILDSQKKATKLLKDVYVATNKWKEALATEQFYHKIKDSMFNDKIDKNILLIKQTEYDLDQKQKEIELLSTKNKLQQLRIINKNRIIWIIGVVLALLIFLAFLIASVLKKNKEVNKLLVKQNEEKEAMMKEIHHRVKNNLQIINSLLRLQSYEVEDAQVIELFKITQRRVLSMAKLHETMYSTESMKVINAKNYLALILEDIVSSYGLDKKVHINTNVVDEGFSISTLLPISLIVNEIVTNSMKYAFHGQEEGCIELNIIKELDSTYIMTIGDDGAGIDEAMKKGLGTKLISIFTRQLNGTIELLDRPGTYYQLTFQV